MPSQEFTNSILDRDWVVQHEIVYSLDSPYLQTVLIRWMKPLDFKTFDMDCKSAFHKFDLKSLDISLINSNRLDVVPGIIPQIKIELLTYKFIQAHEFLDLIEAILMNHSPRTSFNGISGTLTLETSAPPETQ